LARYRAVSLVHLRTAQSRELDILRDKKILAFCGIGNPESFEKLLKSLGASQVVLVRFPDHHIFEDLDFLNSKNYAEQGFEMAITTEKDSVRFPLNWHSDLAIYYLKIKIDFSPQELLPKLLAKTAGFKVGNKNEKNKISD
jgi:tetraacyldisaccharide 4'-kinase